MVLGNHDYHGHSHELISKKVEQAGFKMLTNDHVHIRINGTRLNLYGVDDAIFGEPKVPETVEINEFNILLTHNLDAIDRRCSPYLDLMLSGHTHWGEFRFMDGTQLMKFWGYCQDINRHTRGWDRLTERTLSLVHPGLMRYYVPRALCHPPGFVILRLLAQEHDASSTR
jgi:predicted MPP superfamily phosphohydrolase